MRALTLALLLVPVAAVAEPARRVSVAAGANLRVVLEQVITAFEERNPGADVQASYGASGALASQLENGAPFDLFLSADTQSAGRVAALGLAAGPPFSYALGRLALWVPASVKLDLDELGLKALADASVVKVAIANPATSPYGAAAEEALRSAGVAAAVKSKLVLGQSAGQAAQFAYSGNAQAALLPLSLAMAPPLSTEGRFVVVPAAAHRPIEQAGVVLKRARDAALTWAFVAFLRGEEGRAILERGGYGLPVVK